MRSCFKANIRYFTSVQDDMIGMPSERSEESAYINATVPKLVV